MPSTAYLLAALVPFATGCLFEDEPPQPNVASLKVTMRWTEKGQRAFDFAVPKDIPCTGTEGGFLGETGIECTSAPWTLTVDGLAVATTPVTCTSAHDGLFGPVPKLCNGGSTTANLSDGASAEVEIVATSDVDERRITLRNVRRTFRWTEIAPVESLSDPGIVRVDGLDVVGGDAFAAWFTPPSGGAAFPGGARPVTDHGGVLEMSIDSAHPNGVHMVRVQAYAREEGVRIAVPLEGTMTLAL